MKEKIIRFAKRVGIFFKELMNILTNVLVPLMAVIVAVLEVLPVPTTWVQIAKKIEYWLFNAYGTAKDIEKIVNEKIKK